MKYRFEAWEDDEGITFATTEGIKWQREKGLLGNNPKLLHVIDADTPEEAKAVHHIKMGGNHTVPQVSLSYAQKGVGLIIILKVVACAQNAGKFASI